ncbi:LOW QUALITY PROTEIN: otogelin [Falco rusticolus]|uniref:LOW QUALITY PROTEIN: otogelin n=1 Tax=Falco rusticolus TaxID=120794 RepID=UPI0018869345|nr:LOW QUALITY PROTEIN: otogelin [Falco rusticolus]
MEARLLLGALLCAWLSSALSLWGAWAQLPAGGDVPLPSPSSAAGQQRGDGLAAATLEPGMAFYNASSTTIPLSQNRRLHSMKCGLSNSLTCFNGGECVYRELCNCSRFNATGPRCQTVYNTGAERDHICRTWGQYNFETFDGLYYYFSGKSTYALVRHTELDEQSFSIQVNNDPECYSSPYSCKRSISLFFSGDEQIKMSSEITYKGSGVQLPYIIGNLHIQKLAGYFLVRHQYAFSLVWDGMSAVYIKMAPDYLGKTHGLCGNNNAILQDDLETSYGKLTDDVTEFVESWQEDPPQGTPSWDKSLLNEPPCLKQSHESLQRAYALCNILLHPPFEQCHEYVSPLPFMASCTNDLCMSAVDNATWCRALTEYARACAQAGKPLHGWRMHFQQCVITCAEPLTYNECINCCPVSCHQQPQCIDSDLPCIDGCYCPDGLIYENELCVKPIDCPCDYHGSFFEMGSVVYEECNNCTCIGGKWICTNLTCPAECSVSGDIHFTTFDGRKYTFQATCQYILAKSRTSGAFTISLQNAPCGQNQDGSCIQSISLILTQDPKRQVTLTHSGDVLVYDHYKINLPYADELFEIRKLSSVFLQVKTHIGLQILYDREGLRLYLQADGRWKDDTAGLCGTFNGNMEDDFLSPVGVTESTPELFGNTWKTSSACVLVHDSSQMDPCDIHLQAASYAAEACSILTKELFAPCYPYLSPVPYFEQCRRDTCKCGQICFCSALAHYAHHCRRFGVVIDFRRGVPDCALSCDDTKEYSTCGSICGRTCQALSVPETCSSDCVEGCACPSGMYLNSKTERCVERNECPCYFQGIDYPPGENVMTSLGKCHCRDGVMNCDNNVIAHSCPAGQIYINCSNPQVDPELSRERTCENQLLNLTFSGHLPCVSGCVCPPGLVKHGDVCLDADECPCSWKGKEYFPGDKVISSCHTCICQHGSFQCTFHPCPSMCTAYGDRHYRTFDGLTFDFVGTCKVYLVKGTSSTSLSVVIENINCFNTGIICRKNIFINVGKSFLIFDDETGNPSLSSYIDKLQKMQLWKAGFFTVVHFPDEDITILWDQRTTVHVQMGHQWQSKLTGLCGNFDLKTVNELRTPDNFELTNSQEFGNSWTAVECVDSSDIRNPCSLNPLREPFAKKECGILLSEAFEACHSVIDVTWFYSNCLTDTCGCNQGGDCECFCTSVSAYAHQCCQHGVAVDWRSPRVCPYDCEYFNKALGKGPYKLVSYLDGKFVMAVKLVDGGVFPVREDDIVPGHAVSFMLTSGLYKPKAHDSNLISFETAERPNYFLQLVSNNTLVLSKWKKKEEFHNRSTFVIHKNTWLSGYSSFESFAKRGYFIHISASSVDLLKYHHSEEFRLSTLFKLVDVKFEFRSHSACEWHYDACTSPCFKTCRDPLGKNCQSVPKVEGCIPVCPLNMLLDEITQRCVYFEDCIEPADGSPPLLPSIQTLAVSRMTSSTSLAAISEVVTSFPVTEAKDMETTLASRLQLTAATGKTDFSAVTSNTTLSTITLASSISSQSTAMTSGRSTIAMFKATKSNVSLSSPVDISPLFPSTLSSEIPTKVQPISSGSTKLLKTTEPQSVTATHAVTTSTESEGKPIATLISTGTPLRRTEMPVKTKIMEISEIATRTLPMKEAQVKPEELTTFTPSAFESITQKTTAYLPRFSMSPPTGMPSYTPLVNLTGTSEGPKISIGQSFTTAANVTVTSFSPVITTFLKPASSATTKAATVLTEKSMKTTFSPTSTPPISLGMTITKSPIETVQHLTGTAEVPFSTTLGPRTTIPITLQTQERSSEKTLLSFTTHKKETPKTTSHVEHMSSSYFPPYSLHPSSTTEKSVTFSTKRPSVSVPSPASPASGELKKTFKTVSTTGYPSYTVLNTTEFLTTLYTKYPVTAETIRVTPLTVEVTSPFELAKSTLSSGRTSTDYKSTLVSSTAKTSTSAYSGSVATSAMKPPVSSKETTTVPFMSTERESAQRTSITGSPLTLLTATATTLLATQPDKSQVEKIASTSTRKPSAFPFSLSSSLISLNISLPSLPSYGKEASLTALSPMPTSHEMTSFYPRTTIAKSMLPTEKTSPALTFSILSTLTEQSSPITTVSYYRSPGKAILDITHATFFPSSEFTSQLVTTKKVMTAKEKSTLSPSVVLPVTKPPYTFSTSQYLADKLVSSPSLTHMMPVVTTTPKYPIETKLVSTTWQSTIQSITDTAKFTVATTQPSFPPSSVGPFSWQASSGDKLSVQTTKAVVIPHFSTQKAIELGYQTSESSLTSQSITPIYQYPAETLTKSTGHPQRVFSTTEATVELTSSYPFSTSRPEGTQSSIFPTSAGPAQVILPTEKELHLTDSVMQPYVSRTTTLLQSVVPTRTTADLIFGKSILPSSPEVFAPSSSLATIKKETFPSFSTQKAATGLKFTWQASFTGSLDSRQTLETTTASPGSKSTSSLALPETTEIPITMRSGPSTSTSKSGTEKTMVLPKQVTLSTTTYSSTFLASSALSDMAHSSAATSASSLISSTRQNVSILSATSDKAEVVAESITSSVKPTSFSVTSEAEGAVPIDTVKSEKPELTKVQAVHTQGATPGTPQTFYSPYFTNTTAVPSNVSVSVLSSIGSSSEPKSLSSIAASSVSTTQTSKLEISSEMQTPVSSLLMISDHPNDTTAPSVSSFPSLSTKPLYGLTTTFSDGLATAEAVSGAPASAFMLPRETATPQTCTPITENECIKHICLDGQLIQVNKSQNCPYNATQPSCGVLGFATQMNGDKCCPKWECACRCTIFSDLSIVTYDGNYVALFKEASYVVSQTQDETITIHILDCRTSNSNSTSLCLAMLNLTYVSNQIIINRLSRKITVNSRFAWPTVRKYGYKVEDTGFKYAVETPTKIRIQWFHNTGVMIFEFNSSSEPRALGLCGVCDRSLENDLMLPNRTVLSKSSAPSTFIDSWQVPDTLKYVGEDRHRETNCSVMDCSECLRMVLNQTFSSCHPYVPPELFCDIWVRDTEYIRNPCISLAAYVAMCNKFNICIEWRSSDYCPFPCSENFSYQACIAACEVPHSCQNNAVASLDSDSCSVLTEGCICAGGTILHRAHTAVCIPEEKCACTDSSGVPHAVGEIWKTSLSGCCMQTCVDSETIIPVEYNCSDIHNLDCQRFAEVALLVPGDQTCCPQKICICNRSLCEPLIPECNGLEKLVAYYSEESCCPSYVCECDPAKCEPMEQMPSCRDDQTLIAARVESTCCISYICACGACSDQIPKCQEGEVLIVDGNTTERCCPTYQCICEIYRCPEFKCMLGMSLVEVWSPEKCCPFRICECACETIPKPQCELGQKLQIDEQFQNSTENICNCVKYKCVRDKVCLTQERGVLLPGQTIMEHSADGICRTSYCTNVIDPSTKYYQINTSLIDCAVKCQANQVYQPPKDLTTCCGSCKNLSCLHTFSNGTVSNFKPGAVWISNCIRYECTNTAIGPLLVSSSVGCPPFNETECVKVGGYVVPFLEGCCKTCKEDGKFCKKVTVRMTIRKNDCRSNTPVNIVSCDGKCPSASIYNYNINTYARFCKCCRELGLQKRTVQLYCTSNSTWVSYSIQEPTDCSCQWS